MLSSVTSHATMGKQNTHTRKSSSNAKNSDNKTPNSKVQSHHSSNPTESSSQGIPTNKQVRNRETKLNDVKKKIRLTSITGSR